MLQLSECTDWPRNRRRADLVYVLGDDAQIQTHKDSGGKSTEQQNPQVGDLDDQVDYQCGNVHNNEVISMQ